MRGLICWENSGLIEVKFCNSVDNLLIPVQQMGSCSQLFLRLIAQKNMQTDHIKEALDYLLHTMTPTTKYIYRLDDSHSVLPASKIDLSPGQMWHYTTAMSQPIVTVHHWVYIKCTLRYMYIFTRFVFLNGYEFINYEYLWQWILKDEIIETLYWGGGVTVSLHYRT